MLWTVQPNAHLLEALNEQEAEYLLVGGLAVLHYCPDRKCVDDLDLLINATPENARKVVEAIRRLGRDNLVYSEDSLAQIRQALAKPKLQFPLKWPPLNTDILTPAEGVDFCSLLDNSVEAHVNELPVRVMPIGDLIRYKEGDNPEDRDKNQRDLRLLRQALQHRLEKSAG